MMEGFDNPDEFQMSEIFDPYPDSDFAAAQDGGVRPNIHEELKDALNIDPDLDEYGYSPINTAIDAYYEEEHKGYTRTTQITHKPRVVDMRHQIGPKVAQPAAPANTDTIDIANDPEIAAHIAELARLEFCMDTQIKLLRNELKAHATTELSLCKCSRQSYNNPFALCEIHYNEGLKWCIEDNAVGAGSIKFMFQNILNYVNTVYRPTILPYRPPSPPPYKPPQEDYCQEYLRKQAAQEYHDRARAMGGHSHYSHDYFKRDQPTYDQSYESYRKRQDLIQHQHRQEEQREHLHRRRGPQQYHPLLEAQRTAIHDEFLDSQYDPPPRDNISHTYPYIAPHHDIGTSGRSAPDSGVQIGRGAPGTTRPYSSTVAHARHGQLGHAEARRQLLGDATTPDTKPAGTTQMRGVAYDGDAASLFQSYWPAS